MVRKKISQHRPEVHKVPVATNWLLSATRATLALIGGLIITFTFSMTSVALGFGVLAGYTILLGVAYLVWFPKVKQRAVRNAHITVAVISILAGIAASIFIQSHNVSIFLLIVTIWAAVTGFAELYLGFAHRGKFAEHRDWLFAGIMTCVLALASLIIDPDYRDEYLVPGNGKVPDFEGAVTGSLFGIGVFGVYLIVIGVFLLIGAYSLRNPQSKVTTETSEGTEG